METYDEHLDYDNPNADPRKITKLCHCAMPNCNCDVSEGSESESEDEDELPLILQPMHP